MTQTKTKTKLKIYWSVIITGLCTYAIYQIMEYNNIELTIGMYKLMTLATISFLMGYFGFERK